MNLPDELLIRLSLIAVALLLVSSCSDVPKAYRFDTGDSPQHQDDEIRFRASYYLRVFDLCPQDRDAREYSPPTGFPATREKGSLRIVRDSLFRFRMTGQTSALFSNIRFESGVLKANEIDRFGQTVRYDDDRQKHELTRESVSHSQVVEAEHKSILCPNGNPALQRSYLIGPEGIREIDPNERLIMAMYSDAKPLIDSLKDLSVQRVNQDAEQLLPFDIELSKARAEAALSALKSNKNSDQNPGSLPPPSVFAERLLPLFTDGGLR